MRPGYSYCRGWEARWRADRSQGRRLVVPTSTLSLSFAFISSVQSLSCVRLFATPWTAAHQASLSITNSWSLLQLKSTESVMPSSHLILCRPLLPPSIFPSIRVFSNESALLCTHKQDKTPISLSCSEALIQQHTGF